MDQNRRHPAIHITETVEAAVGPRQGSTLQCLYPCKVAYILHIVLDTCSWLTTAL